MKANQALYPVALMCSLLSISRSGFYAWLRRPPSARAQRDEVLTEQIRAVHAASRGTYGAPRIQADLREQAAREQAAQPPPSRKRVARLMRNAGLEGASRRRFRPTTTIREEAAKPAPDLVERDFTASEPNQLWVADITYVPTWSGFLYLAVVLDVFSRKVVGWSMATHMRTELVLNALKMAVQQRGPTQVIHHSDQGSQYTSYAFGEYCRQWGVRPSTGSVGDCFDNAMAESFFATLECELLDRAIFRSPAEGAMGIFQFIEGWYNTRRRHSSIGHISPAEFEKQHKNKDHKLPKSGSSIVSTKAG